ncbi:MAG TPA: hypothetical protein DCZ93_00060 [Elusimicrobia bacterium]|nr:hypothetical protein [Elusimicrobiota bacterium]
MMNLDIYTLLMGQLLVSAVCALTVFLLWKNNRDRYDGLGLWFWSYVTQAVYMALLLLRGHVPDFVSIVLANTIGVGGILFLCAGLRRFFGRPLDLDPVNLGGLAVFVSVLYYYTAVQPSLPHRNLNFNAFLLFFCARCAWFTARAEAGELRRLSLPLRHTLLAFCGLSLLRISYVLIGHPAHEFLREASPDSVFIMVYSALVGMLTFSLFLLVNRRLMSDMEADFNGRMEAEKVLSGALRVAKLGTWRWDIKSNRLNWSDGMYSIFGIDKNSFTGDLGDVVARAIHPDDRAAVEASNTKVIRDGAPAGLAYRVIWPDGGMHWVYAEASELLKDEAGAPSVLKGYAQDITDRKMAEAELSSSKERFQKAFHAAPFLMSLSEIETGRYIEVNDKFCEVTGFSREELLGRTSTEIGWIGCEARARLLRESNGSSLRIPELTLTAKGGRPVVCSYACERVSMGGKNILLAIAEDITSLKKAESAMLVAQKLDALGTLAGGIAHDFNNLLTGITGNLSMMRNMAASGRDIGELVQEAETACFTARGLARQLLTFASGGEPVKVTVDMAALVRESVPFSLRGSPARAEISGGEGLRVLGDREQLFQVLQNLTVNAAQAMAGGGVVLVSVRAEDVSEGKVPALRAGRYVCVEVRDSGSGIAAESLPRIFDPYFSTKGQGRGLGLAVCRSVVVKHGGAIAVVSEPGKGSAFSVYLPLTDRSPSDSGRTAPAPLKVGSGRVLIMDDEEVVYKALRRMLSALGYEAEVVGDGRKALEAWAAAQKSGRPFLAAIMDLTIPGGMGGAEAVKLLKTSDNKAKVLVSSGYSDDPIMAEYASYGFDGVLAKPYRVEDLSAALSKLLT